MTSLLADDKRPDRTTINAWEDIEFIQAAHATGRGKLIICALCTEMCVAFIVVTDRLARSNNAPRQPRLAASLTAKKAS